MKLGHVHLKVTDLDEVVSFYRELFGLEVQEESGRYVFLTDGVAHHVVALQEVDGPQQSSRDRPGLYHVAFEVEDRSALKHLDERLRERGCAVTAVDHGISQSLYFNDPSGNGIEVYVDTREKTGREQWNGQNKPLDLEEGANDD